MPKKSTYLFGNYVLFLFDDVFEIGHALFTAGLVFGRHYNIVSVFYIIFNFAAQVVSH